MPIERIAIPITFKTGSFLAIEDIKIYLKVEENFSAFKLMP